MSDNTPASSSPSPAPTSPSESVAAPAEVGQVGGTLFRMRAFLVRHQWICVLGCFFSSLANLICIYASPKVIDYSFGLLGFLCGVIVAVPLVRDFYRGRA